MFALLTFLKENNFTCVVYFYQLGHLGNEKKELGISCLFEGCTFYLGIFD